MEKQLSGKTALVTGASRGIGAAIARRLASDGANVVITYTSAPDKAAEVVSSIEKAGGKALAVKADSASVTDVREAVAATVNHFGGIDILVNNAGIAVMAPVGEYSIDDFDRMVAVNVRAAFVAAQEASKHMKDGGRIITIGSTNSERMPFMGGSVYAMTKAAVAGLTKGLARDLGPRKITVNNVQPGPVDTDMNPATGEFADTLRGYLALGRYGHGEEIAGMVAYLAGPEAAYVTGASLLIDGGFAA